MTAPAEPLTLAEQRVLAALLEIGAAQPKLHAHIAVATGYAVNSVNNYLARLRKKYGVGSNADLASSATTHGTLFNPRRDSI